MARKSGSSSGNAVTRFVIRSISSRARASGTSGPSRPITSQLCAVREPPWLNGSAGIHIWFLRRLNEELGKTLMVVTHDDVAAQRCKRVLHLDKGVLLDGSATAQA